MKRKPTAFRKAGRAEKRIGRAMPERPRGKGRLLASSRAAGHKTGTCTSQLRGGTSLRRLSRGGSPRGHSVVSGPARTQQDQGCLSGRAPRYWNRDATCKTEPRRGSPLRAASNHDQRQPGHCSSTGPTSGGRGETPAFLLWEERHRSVWQDPLGSETPHGPRTRDRNTRSQAGGAPSAAGDQGDGRD